MKNLANHVCTQRKTKRKNSKTIFLYLEENGYMPKKILYNHLHFTQRKTDIFARKTDIFERKTSKSFFCTQRYIFTKYIRESKNYDMWYTITRAVVTYVCMPSLPRVMEMYYYF